MLHELYQTLTLKQFKQVVPLSGTMTDSSDMNKFCGNVCKKTEAKTVKAEEHCAARSTCFKISQIYKKGGNYA